MKPKEVHLTTNDKKYKLLKNASKATDAENKSEEIKQKKEIGVQIESIIFGRPQSVKNYMQNTVF